MLLKKSVAILLFVTLHSLAFGQSQKNKLPQKKTEEQINQDLINEQIESYQKQYKKDSREFFRSIVFKSVGILKYKLSAKKIQFLKENSDELYDFLLEKNSHDKAGDPWQLTVLPDEFTSANLAFNIFDNPFAPTCEYGIYNACPLAQEKVLPLLDSYLNDLALSPSLISHINNRKQELLANQKGQDSRNATLLSTGNAMAFCLLLGANPLKVLDCVEAMKKIPAIMEQRWNILLVTEHHKLLTDSNLAKGLLLMAKKIIKRAEETKAFFLQDSWNKKKLDANIDLYQDLYSSFIESGLEEKRATEATWTILGVLAAGGPDSHHRILNFTAGKGAYHIQAAIMIISQTLPYLDVMYSKLNRLYSFPSNIATTMNTSKAYHFWMAAYLAHKIYEQNQDESNAQLAAFSANVGYQLFSEHGDRNPALTLTLPVLHPIHLLISMDMHYAAAGSLFGVMTYSEFKKKNITMDNYFMKAIGQAKYFAPLRSQEASDLYKNNINEYALKWSNIFSPGKIINDYSWATFK